MLERTLRVLTAVPRLSAVLVVLAVDDLDAGRSSPALRGAPVWWGHVGGPTRAASVANGLAELLRREASPDDWVLVHDAARCLLRPEWVDRLIDACLEDPIGGLLALPLADTLKQATPEGRVAATVDRRGKWAAQTPQMFRIGLLREALQRAGDAVTDEASAIEAMGLQPRLVRGDARNLKVTWPEDFELAEQLLSGQATMTARAGREAA
jgi:2-C-methyl-D-erythritol 4-phosphate cytidylyltransferase